jgi:hypothetical protein
MKPKLFNYAKLVSCITWASLKTGAPKLSAALNFLWLLSLFQDKESNKALDEQRKNRKDKRYCEQSEHNNNNLMELLQFWLPELTIFTQFLKPKSWI